MTALVLHAEIRVKIGTEKQFLRRAQEHKKMFSQMSQGVAVSTYLSRKALPKISGFTKFMMT